MDLDAWIGTLETRYLHALTRQELTRALRALSSCYVERRDRLADGHALGSAGKRAAFAMFYAPLHLLTVREIVKALPVEARTIAHLHDLGCGTGAAGAGWALACESPPRVSGIDRSPWAAAEATWTYRQIGLRGRASPGDLTRSRIHPSLETGVLLAYAVNELTPDRRTALAGQLESYIRGGAHVLVVEPIARRLNPWWNAWADALTALGARADEWRFVNAAPDRLRDLGRSAGLDVKDVTARSLWI